MEAKPSETIKPKPSETIKRKSPETNEPKITSENIPNSNPNWIYQSGILLLSYIICTSFIFISLKSSLFRSISPNIDIYADYQRSVRIFTNDSRLFFYPLNEFILHAPINPRTGRKLIIFSIVSNNELFISLAKNFYCSLRNSGDISKYLVLITDSPKFKEELENIGAKICFIPTLFSTQKVCLYFTSAYLKYVFIEYLLRKNIEVLFLDVDMVVLDNIFDRVNYSMDFIISSEDPIATWKDYNNIWMINTGFMYFLNPRKCYKLIISYTSTLFKVFTWEQGEFQDFLKRSPNKLIKYPNWTVQLQSDKNFYRYQILSQIHLMFVISYKFREDFQREALLQNVSIPMIIHAAFFHYPYKPESAQNKMDFFLQYNMSFLTKDFKQCLPPGSIQRKALPFLQPLNQIYKH